MDIIGKFFRWMIKRLPGDPSTCEHEWEVYCVALEDEFLEVHCRNCSILGAVKEPTEHEWNKALSAPSNPYLWTDKERVSFDVASKAISQKDLAKLEWRPLLNSVKAHCQDCSIFVQTRHHGMLSVNDPKVEKPKSDIVALAITAARKGMKPWDSEEPARALCNKLKEVLGRNCCLQLNRDPDTFVGYYVKIQ